MTAIYCFLGIPVVVVGVLVGVSDLEDFVMTHECWCRAGGMLFWVFVGTISVILLVRTVCDDQRNQ